jgi:hypothetical protein
MKQRHATAAIIAGGFYPFWERWLLPPRTNTR